MEYIKLNGKFGKLGSKFVGLSNSIIPGSGGTDYDGNIYTSIKIGSQEWMVENLKTTHYVNGDPLINNFPDWSGATYGMYSNYDQDSNNVPIYGRLYNWFAIDDGRGLAPTSWRIPSTSDWNYLITYIGSDVCLKLRETGYTYWMETVIPHPGSDKYGYKARAAGQCSDAGVFGNLLYLTEFWHASGDLKSSYILDDIHDIVYVDCTLRKNFGLSVRCMKDA